MTLLAALISACRALACVFWLIWWAARSHATAQVIKDRMERQRVELDAIARANAAAARRPDDDELHRRMRDGTF